jgi:hypothetical protein
MRHFWTNSLEFTTSKICISKSKGTSRHLILEGYLLFSTCETYLDFFIAFAVFGKLLLTFWDFFGALMAISLLMNLWVLFVTMGIYAERMKRGYKFIYAILSDFIYLGLT